jgi:predicted AlkP superfamily pyrophosphatase or phosphodiesterase
MTFGVQRLVVLNVVGLSSSLLGKEMPRIHAFAKRSGLQSFPPTFPAVTCTAQSSMLTGKSVDHHGVVANGWCDRESAEVRFWKQSNRIVRGEKIWDVLREKNPGFTCTNLFWWYNMASTVDYAITPRPLYLADGRKVFDVHTQPMNLREEIKLELGEFPFPSFWGPAAGINSSKWIANSARWMEEKYSPNLNLVYLPHLDYCLQKFGPDAPENIPELNAIDDVVGDLIDFFEQRNVKVIIVSEYGISKVNRAIHLNRELRKLGLLSIKNEDGRDGLDIFMSDAFAVADHQVAHVYVREKHRITEMKSRLEKIPGVEKVQLSSEIWSDGVAIERAGDLIVTADDDAWFTYYFWEDDQLAPDYARCIDIHRKPGYDPVELFIDPTIGFPKLNIAKILLKKKLGFRALMEIIPLNANLVKGSHGKVSINQEEQPVIIGAVNGICRAEDVFEEIKYFFEKQITL